MAREARTDELGRADTGGRLPIQIAVARLQLLLELDGESRLSGEEFR